MYILQVSLARRAKRRVAIVIVTRTGVKIRKPQEAQRKRVAAAAVAALKAKAVATRALSHYLQNSPRLSVRNRWLDMKL